MESKADIRKAMLAQRRAMGEAERAAACGYVCDKLSTITLPEPLAIAGYLAIHGEVDISQALGFYHERQNPVCLPTVTQAELILQFKRWTPGAPLVPGVHGTREPAGGETMLPDVLLVPLVAFDRQGHRLGYGGGYYDATIAALKARNPRLLTVGIGYSFQEVTRLPSEEHDMRLDRIITDSAIIVPDPATSAGLGT